MEDYILNHIDEEPYWLNDIYRDANLRLLYPRMVSGHLQGRILKTLTQMIRPARALELGTFAGYSALCIAEGLDKGATLETIEISDELEDFIREHLAKSPFNDRINLHIGDAMEIVPRLHAEGGDWNMVFVDADKRQYPAYYEMLLGYLSPGGWMLVDNTLWNGVLEKISVQSPTIGKHDLQAVRIAEFNELVRNDPRVEKVILPIRDGITVIRQKL